MIHKKLLIAIFAILLIAASSFAKLKIDAVLFSYNSKAELIATRDGNISTHNSSAAAPPDANGIIYVKQNASGDGSSWTNAIGDLQAAINQAGVKEVWVASGEYQPAPNASFSMKQGVKIYGGFPNVGTPNMNNRNWRTQETILKGNGTRVIRNYTLMNTNAVLDGFTITSGQLTATNQGNIYGAGMLNENSASPLINNCTFKTNVIVSDGTQTTNHIFGKGGGMANLSSSPTVTNCVFINNIAFASGGGIYNENATPVIKACVFSANSVTATQGQNGGGGIFNTGTNSLPSISDCLFVSNQAAYGAAIRNSFTGNTRYQDYINCTFYNNQSSGGSIYNSATVTTFINSILWGGSQADDVKLLNAGAPDFKYSLQKGINRNTNGNLDGTLASNDPQFVNAANPAGADGLFGTADDGLALKKESLLISRGSNTLYGANLATNKDVAGNLRLQKGGVDLGAYETAFAPIPIPDANGIVYVKQNGSGNFLANSWDNAAPEIADALVAAKNSTAIKEIWVAGGTYKPLYSAADNNFGNADGRNNTFLLVNNVKLFGGFPTIGNPLPAERNPTLNQTILSGDFNNDDVVTGSGTTLSISGNAENAYHVLIAAGPMGTAEFDGFYIRSGNASDNSNVTVNGLQVYNRNGAGLTNIGASYAIKNCHFESNYVYFGAGAGMLNTGGANTTISECRFVNNVAFYITNQGWGDEIAGAGMANISSNPVIERSEFVSNVTTGGRFGGAVYNSSSSAVFHNSKFNNNVAGAGGAFFNTSSNAVLTNLAVYDNLAFSHGGAICNVGSSPVLTNVTVANNVAQDGAVGGGGLFYDTNSGGSVRNSILWGNTAGAANGKDEIASNNVGQNKLRVSNSIVKDYSTGASGLNYDAENIITQDPKFMSATDFRLQTGSPAINAGDKTLFEVGKTPDLSSMITDLVGNGRIEGASVDLGAYEMPAVLPVTFGEFTATKQLSGIALKWHTLSERDNKAFILRRSSDGKSFIELDRVASKGNSTAQTNYTYLDYAPLTGLNYYQLQQIDNDGTITTLGYSAVQFSLADNELSVYPNPAVGLAKVTLGNSASYKEARLIDIYGKQLASKRILIAQEQLTFDVANLPKGIYFIELLGDSKKSLKLVKQ
jgi:hypothetical protein